MFEKSLQKLSINLLYCRGEMITKQITGNKIEIMDQSHK